MRANALTIALPMASSMGFVACVACRRGQFGGYVQEPVGRALGSALASWGVSASSRSHAMRSALIAASWAQAVLIAKSREGKLAVIVTNHDALP
jgi:hypothetical protein